MCRSVCFFVMTAKRAKFYFQKRQNSAASHHCCVPKCTASARCNSVISFHTFPKDAKLRRRWLTSIRRDDFIATDSTRICSRHFTTTDLLEPLTPTCRRLLKKGAVPVLFDWNDYSLPATRPCVWDRTERPDPPDAAPAPDDNGQTMATHLDHDYCSTAGPEALNLSLGEKKDSQEKKLEEMAFLSKFGLERFQSSDEDIRFYTRFSTYGHLLSFWSQIEPAVHNILRVTRAQSQIEDARQAVNAKSFQPIDEFFLFMNYLSLGLMPKDLGIRFGVNESTVSRIINTWANFLYNMLGAVGIWLDEETIQSNMPEVFYHYSDTHVILDCTELRYQTRDSLLVQSEVFSSYRSHSTVKGLIGLAPHGSVMFVSSVYEGSISDQVLLKKSGLVSLLKPSMAIIVDKGFLIEHSVPCKVYIPAFLEKKSQLSGAEVKKTQSIARLRVHVERIIHRVKEHKLFSSVIPFSLTGSINQLFAVACLLVNYQNRPLVKAWAKN